MKCRSSMNFTARILPSLRCLLDGIRRFFEGKSPYNWSILNVHGWLKHFLFKYFVYLSWVLLSYLQTNPEMIYRYNESNGESLVSAILGENCHDIIPGFRYKLTWIESKLECSIPSCWKTMIFLCAPRHKEATAIFL